MDQSVIEAMKGNYRRLLLRLLLQDKDNEKEEVLSRSSSQYLKDQSYMVIEAQVSVSPTILKETYVASYWTLFFGRE